MQRREKIALQKICSEIGLALKFVKNFTLEEFLADEKTKHAVGMAAINIGELTKHLSQEFRKNYSEIEFKQAIKFRDVIAHRYETLDMEDVFETITKDFPKLKAQIEKILKFDE